MAPAKRLTSCGGNGEGGGREKTVAVGERGGRRGEAETAEEEVKVFIAGGRGI